VSWSPLTAFKHQQNNTLSQTCERNIQHHAGAAALKLQTIMALTSQLAGKPRVSMVVQVGWLVGWLVGWPDPR
jgi:hypothetical protein